MIINQLDNVDLWKLPVTAKGGTYHCDGNNLYLFVKSATARSWLVRYQWGKERRSIGLGSLVNVTLEEARDQAIDIARMVRKGMEPKANRPGSSAAHSTPVFEDFARVIMAKLSTGRTTKNTQRWARSIEVYAKPLHGKQLHTITTPEVIACLEPTWHSKAASTRYARAHLEAVFAAARVLEHMDCSKPNPASREVVKVLLGRQNAETENYAAIDWRDMPELMGKLKAKNTLGSWMLQAQILTCVRSGELISMDWQDIRDLEGARPRWVIAGKTMKNGKQADVPLVPQMVELLLKIKSLQLCDTMVFPGLKRGQRMSNNTMLKLLQVYLGYDATVHGNRASFRSWGQTQSKVHDRATLEMCLHHIEGSAAELAYKREDIWDLRKAALIDWANYVTTPVTSKPKLSLVA